MFLNFPIEWIMQSGEDNRRGDDCSVQCTAQTQCFQVVYQLHESKFKITGHSGENNLLQLFFKYMKVTVHLLSKTVKNREIDFKCNETFRFDEETF